MYTLISTFSFEAAHRLYNVDTYSRECRLNLHGHSYKLTVYLGCTELNNAGMVIDFKLFKRIVNDTIIDRYDHSCILRECDPILPVIRDNCQKVYSYEESPTAEWMARWFFKLLQDRFKLEDPRLVLRKVSVQETENNIASYSEEGHV